MSQQKLANLIIDALGGTTQTASICRCSPSAVSLWRKDGIPDYRLQFLELLRPDIFRKAKKKLHKVEYIKQA